jgi:hypothetical protein
MVFVCVRSLPYWRLVLQIASEHGLTFDKTASRLRSHRIVEMLGLGIRAGVQKRGSLLASCTRAPNSVALFSSFVRTPIRSRLPLGQPRVTLSSIRHKSIFQHPWFHPEPKPGEPPRESFRVFWTVSALLLGFSGVYVYYIDPWITEKWRASPIAGFTKPRGEPVFDKDNFFPYVIKHVRDYNHNTRLLVLSL